MIGRLTASEEHCLAGWNSWTFRNFNRQF
jgi:hypothetical protein